MRKNEKKQHTYTFFHCDRHKRGKHDREVHQLVFLKVTELYFLKIKRFKTFISSYLPIYAKYEVSSCVSSSSSLPNISTSSAQN